MGGNRNIRLHENKVNTGNRPGLLKRTFSVTSDQKGRLKIHLKGWLQRARGNIFTVSWKQRVDVEMCEEWERVG